MADRTYCEHMIWRRGRNIPCGQVVGVTSWTDARGDTHAACVRHLAERLHRFPAVGEQSDPITASKAEALR